MGRRERVERHLSATTLPDQEREAATPELERNSCHPIDESSTTERGSTMLHGAIRATLAP